ncbi:VOC family protein [Streptomyces durhamensis]|uniref:VOC family protein n=1 Tax=Streptomyces durhamensis TaxID=68194 RepID=UPI000689B997|nr:VOC family protein [Streptomyces durhamensis]
MPRRTGYRPGSPCWVDCVTPDLDGTQRFYTELFGWQYTAEGPGYHLARLGGEIIGGTGAAPPGLPPVASWTVYLATKDIDATSAEVRRLGGRIVMGPVATGADGRLCLAVDPDGAPVGFWEGHHDVGVVLADEAGAVCDFELRTPRPERAERFYGGLFGCSVRGEGTGLSLELDGTRLARITRTPPGEQPYWLPHFGATPDAVARAHALGATAPAPNDDLPAPVRLRDPWGAHFALTPSL